MSKRPKASKNKAKNTETPQLPPALRQQANHQQALQFVDSIVALSPVSRQTHIQAQQALQQIGRAIQELEQLKKEKVDG